MEVKKELVDRGYDEEGQPSDDALPELLTVKPEALESFEGTSILIKYEFQTDIRQPSSKEELTLEDSKNDDQSTPFVSVMNNQMTVNEELLLLHSNTTSPTLFDDFEIDEINVKKEVLGHQPIEVVVNLETRVFFERNFVCSICMQVFASIDSLSLHTKDHPKIILSKKSIRNAKKCDQREYKSSTRVTFKTRQLPHTGKKPLACDQCVCTYAYKSQLKTHQLTHTDVKPFECDLCHYKSAHKSYLRTHLLSHTGEKPFSCDQCSCKYARKAHFDRHKITHTRKKLFECDSCKYKFALKTQLKFHQLSHSSEKVFKCDLCFYISAKKSHLKTHQLSHTGEKPFSCDQCSRKYARKAHLNRHKITHTNNKPFVTPM